MMLPYQDCRLSIKDRVNDLLKRMSLQEKVGQVNQHLYGWESYSWQKQDKTITFKKKFIDHVKWGKGLGAIYGLFRADPWSKVDFDNGVPAEDSWIVANAVQKYVIKHRGGIIMLCDNCGKREANVRYSESINGMKKEMNLDIVITSIK